MLDVRGFATATALRFLPEPLSLEAFLGQGKYLSLGKKLL
jgi:hypothetical protein